MRHLWTALLIFLASSIAGGTARTLGQACQGCDGDINGDNQVTIDEIITSVNSALNGCGAIFFKEEFFGSALNDQLWRVTGNGYPASAVTVSNGFLQIGQVSLTSVDFPYVESLATVFPAEGNFQLKIVMQSLVPAAPLGSGVTVLGSGNQEVLRIWTGNGHVSVGLNGVGETETIVDSPEKSHVYEAAFVDGQASLRVDGALVQSGVPFVTSRS